MIGAISGNSSIPIQQPQNSKGLCNIRNISPNELDAITLDMLEKGEISLKDRLAFVPLDIKQLENQGYNAKTKYYDKVWSSPDKKRNMLLEYENILRQQTKDNAGAQNIAFTKNAISILERIAAKNSFQSRLDSQVNKG